MKKTILVLFSILLFVTCKTDTETNLSGKWKVKNVEIDMDISGASVTEEIKETFQILMSAYKNSIIDEMKKNGKLEFFEDKTFKTAFSNEIEVGKFEVLNDGHTLSTTSDSDKKTDLMNIEKEDTNGKIRLVFEMPQKDLNEMKHIEKTEYGDIELSIKKMTIIFEKKEDKQ